MPSPRQLLQILQRINADRPAAPSLAQLSAIAGWSPFHLHRAFRALVGETPKCYTQRLRLERAAVLLGSTDRSAADVARAVGFRSPEVFSRAFRRQLGCTPTRYRRRARSWGEGAHGHGAITETIGPCVGLFKLNVDPVPERSAMSQPVVSREERPSVPVLFLRRRIAPSAVASVLGECLPAVYAHCQRRGLAFGGPPFTRHARSGPGLITLECGMPLADAAEGDAPIEAGALQGGTLAVAIHQGGYDTLAETYACVEAWIESEGHAPAGPPWETYLTDPAEHPDPADWRTEICWPIAAR